MKICKLPFTALLCGTIYVSAASPPSDPFPVHEMSQRPMKSHEQSSKFHSEALFWAILGLSVPLAFISIAFISKFLLIVYLNSR